MARLRRADSSRPGIRRVRRGRGFSYIAPDRTPVRDRATLERIQALVIPPAWEDVWICPDERGHLQAVGVDTKGRRQYRYHDEWRKRRDVEKFDHMLEFGRALPKIRHFCAEHLAEEGLTRNRVLACAVRLLDLGFFRIGGEGYAAENETYGLATMGKRHAKVVGDVVTFDYVAKGGKRRLQCVVDADVAEVVAMLKARRGGSPELLAWKQGTRWVDVRSADINAYIKEFGGGDFTAKDFRTWNATVLAATALSVSAEALGGVTSRKRALVRCFQEVSHYLGNTPAVCRSSYVDPRVIDRFRGGATILAALGDPDQRDVIEQAVLGLLDE
ncbi:MAG: DNA topoisomerase IB [Actinobacteria bacterium]|nr:DNA topoisomerase IB [Actinomycetota bacterium]